MPFKCPDWSIWCEQSSLAVWKVCALSLDLDPDLIYRAWGGHYKELESFPSTGCYHEFKRRIRVALCALSAGEIPSDNYDDDGEEYEIRLEALVEFALCRDWEIPDAMKKFAPVRVSTIGGARCDPSQMVAEYVPLQEAADMCGRSSTEILHLGCSERISIYALIPAARLVKRAFERESSFPEDRTPFFNTMRTADAVRLWKFNAGELEAEGETLCRIVDVVDSGTGKACAYEVHPPHRVKLQHVRIMQTDIDRMRSPGPHAPISQHKRSNELAGANVPASASRQIPRHGIVCVEWRLVPPYTMERLKRDLSDVPKWLEPARVTRGGRGAGRSATWNPALLANCLVDRKRATQAGMRTTIKQHFTEWLEEYEQYLY